MAALTRSSSRWRAPLGAGLVAAVTYFLPAPANAQTSGCTATAADAVHVMDVQGLIDRLKADPFVDAFEIYLRDLEALRPAAEGLRGQVGAVLEDCGALEREFQTLSRAVAAYKASECGQAEAPAAVITQCAGRLAGIQETQRTLGGRAGMLSERWRTTTDLITQFGARAAPAIERARVVLDAKQTESSLRLFIAYRLKQPARRSCEDLAVIAERLGRRVSEPRLFLGLLVRSLSGGSRELDLLIPRGDVKPFAMDASGFIPRFYADVRENQVRHVLAYMAVGFVFNGSAADLAGQVRDEMKGEPQDYWLGVEGGQMGIQLKTGIYDTRNFGRAVRARLCR